MNNKYKNRLAEENSPYLLQHAHNPVDWYPWSEEAFEKAKSENKPILVSIGYSTCHWCHVMERESFEDEGIAAYMNKHFVNIKVDREERPDVDNIYMEAVQLVTSGAGGWPLNCFLLPDGRPFFGGTYFPPKPAHGRASWAQVLSNIQNAFSSRPQEVEEQAQKLMEYINNSDAYFINKIELSDPTQSIFNFTQLENTYYTIREGFDRSEGGFGNAPKFPGTMSLQYCLNYYYYTGSTEALNHVLFSLDKMAQGGIYDHLGGGFSRYTVDKAWLVPHFEKMLYDNALLLGLYAEAYQLTGKALYKETIEETDTWLMREMYLAEEAAFYAALDADSEGVEGKFYVWSKDEIDAALGEASKRFCQFYDVTEHGNWEHNNILHRGDSYETFAEAMGIDLEQLKAELKAGREKLLSLRSTRIRPGLDDKILLPWNAMMCTAYCKLYRALGLEKYKTTALENAQFMLRAFAKTDGRLWHSYKNGVAKYDAFLDDYALLIEALIELYQIDFNEDWLLKAKHYTDLVLEEFLDEKDQLFFYTAASQKDIILRKKDLYDNAMPSGNSTMIQNLQKLAVLLGEEKYATQAKNSLQPMLESIVRYARSFSRWANCLFTEVYAWKEVAIVGPLFDQKARALQKYYLPNALFAAADKETATLPLLADRGKPQEASIFVCSNFTCQRPTAEVAEALKQIVP